MAFKIALHESTHQTALNALNQAVNPKCLLAQKVSIRSRGIKNPEGRFVSAQKEQDFIKGLLVGQETGGTRRRLEQSIGSK